MEKEESSRLFISEMAGEKAFDRGRGNDARGGVRGAWSRGWNPRGKVSPPFPE